MHEIVNKFFLAGDKFTPQVYLKHSICVPFAKNKKRIQKFKGAGDLRYIYQIEPNKSCFQHDMAYRDFKDLPRTTASDKLLPDKAFSNALM